MIFYAIAVSGGSFPDEKTGKTIEYGHVHTQSESVESRDGFSGLEVKKVKCGLAVYNQLKNSVPCMIECEIEIVGKDNQLKISSAKVTPTKSKAA